MPHVPRARRARALVVLGLAQLLLALSARMGAVAAQDAPVMLRVNPHVGDTLRTLLDQQMEITASAAGYLAQPTRTIVTDVTIRAHTVVRSAQGTSTTVLTTVDSAVMTSTDTRGAAQVADAERVLRGQQLVLQLGMDGTVESARDASGALVSREAGQAMAAMPAVFPRSPVRVGDHWTREMPLPSGGPLSGRGSGHARAVFRLDSVARGGTIAYVSMKGDILPDSSAQGVELSGSISGSMQLDRTRGWMTDSRFVVVIRSLVQPPLEMGMVPMRFLTRVTQRLRTMDKR